MLVGSSRQGGNGAGIAYWLSTILKRQLNTPNQSVEVVAVNPTVPPHPLGAVVDGSRLPAQVTDPSTYASPAVQEWSKFVSSCAGFAVVSPEYNGGYPGELKNSFDHLFHEWANKPVLLLTYGGGGGTRVAAQLQLLMPAFKMKVVANPVSITLPRSFIGGPDRVLADNDDFPEFLSNYEGPVSSAAAQLARSLFSPSSE